MVPRWGWWFAATLMLAAGTAAGARADLSACYQDPTHACVADAMAERYQRLDAEFAATDAEMGIEPQYPPGWFAVIAALEGYVPPSGDLGAQAWVNGAVADVIAPFFASYPEESDHFETLRNLVVDRLTHRASRAVLALLTFFEQEVEAGRMTSAQGTPQFPDEAWAELFQLTLHGYAELADAQLVLDHIADANVSVPLQRELDAIRQAAEAGRALNPGLPDFNTWYAPGSLPAMQAQLAQVPPDSESWARWATMTAIVEALEGDTDAAADLLVRARDVAAGLRGDPSLLTYTAWGDSLNRQKLLNIIARAQATILALEDSADTVRLIIDEMNSVLATADGLEPQMGPGWPTPAEQRQRIAQLRRDMTVPLEDLAETVHVLANRTTAAAGAD